MLNNVIIEVEYIPSPSLDKCYNLIDDFVKALLVNQLIYSVPVSIGL